MLFAADFSPWFFRGLAFVFGAVWGSFFNVAIYRWPREMSVVHPPSHCTSCGAPVQVSKNVPIFGWLFLRGKTACCGAPLSGRYAVVETITALLCVAVVEQFLVRAVPGTTLLAGAAEALVYFAFLGGLVIATFVDLEWMEIPDEVSLPGAALGLATAALRTDPGTEAAALGAGAGFLVIQVLFVWSYEHLFGRRGMGEGDSKFLMFIGAFLGWKGAAFALVGGAMQGVVAAGVLLATGRSLMPNVPEHERQGYEPETTTEKTETTKGMPAEDASDEAKNTEAEDDEAEDHDDSALKMPYGPFLALGAIEYLFFGDTILEWYFRILQGG
ncbi:MAG: prepilin peptidase [Myxococcales bacterium]|nr:prepilin peptidase [Myxococcales bacterium]